MTGKLEDAKSVAMRIVGPTNEDTTHGSGSPHAMQLAADSISLGLRSALHHMSTGSGLERMVIDLLSLLDVRIDAPSRVSLAKAMEHKSNGGQTLLHFAAFLNYPELVSFLIAHEADKDARDHNGHTALHFASLVGAQGCATVLLHAGVDVEIVNVEGKTAQELAQFNFADLRAGDSAADGESQWGDGEDSEGETIPHRILSRRTSRVHSVEVAPPSPPEGDNSPVPEKSGKEKEDNIVDEKQAATFMRKIQRTLARVQPKDGIIPNMPHLAFPHLLQLPGMPVVPWGALPQIPTVFTVYVPWPASLRTSRGFRHRRRHEWRHSSEGQNAVIANTARVEVLACAGTQAVMPIPDEDESPPVYTPRAEGKGELPIAETSIPPPERPVARPVGYDSGPVPDDQEVNSYKYLPRKRQPRQIQKQGFVLRRSSR
jgi:hypothetical protein